MEEIRYEVAAGVATLTIDRPAKRGAMTYAMLGEFTADIDEAGADRQVAVLVVTGVPGSFWRQPRRSRCPARRTWCSWGRAGR
jgi:2-(1,2-epoxy-1,2-dihydrophenyl)acetyl-CoA isomerase